MVMPSWWEMVQIFWPRLLLMLASVLAIGAIFLALALAAGQAIEKDQEQRTEAVRLALTAGIEAGAWQREEAVDNSGDGPVYSVSNFLDIDQASYRQASSRRP
jgi:hypothetical protein